MTKLGFTVVAVLAGVVSLIAAVGASAAPKAPRVVGHVYIDDNNAGANTVAGFDRHADGSVTPIPGSPFAIGGTGTGGGLGSQGAIQAAGPGNRYLLAVDAGSSQISVLRLNSRGVPEPVGQPISSGGF